MVGISCGQQNEDLPDLKLFSSQSAGYSEFYYEISLGNNLSAKMIDNVHYDFEKKEYNASKVYDEKAIKLSPKMKNKLLVYIVSLQAKQPTDYSTSMEDAPIITVVLDGKEYKTILADPDFAKKHPDDVDNDILCLMEQLMKLVQFPNDKTWGPLYQWIAKNIK